MVRDLSNTIQRIPELEDRAQVSLGGLSAFLDEEHFLTVSGELTGGELNDDDSLEIILTVFDSGGRVIHTDEYCIYSDDYIGLEPFRFIEDMDGRAPSRIRVHVKRRFGRV